MGWIQQPPRVFRWVYPDAIWRMPETASKVYLTFDDGPVYGVTDTVLELLDKEGVKASFFCVGDNVRKNLELFQAIQQHGHTVGNHSMFHRNGLQMPDAEFQADIQEASDFIPSRWYRPPYGKMKWSQYHWVKQHYRIALWDVLTEDYRPEVNAAHCVAAVKKYTRPGSLIVFHDSLKARQNVLNALPEAIAFLKDSGYEFSALPQD